MSAHARAVKLAAQMHAVGKIGTRVGSGILVHQTVRTAGICEQLTHNIRRLLEGPGKS